MSSSFHYNWLLDHVAIPAVSNNTTSGIDLKKFCDAVFGKKFHGVYMSDNIPDDFNMKQPYGIINLDRSDDPGDGSHWIAVAFHRRGMLVYDSFGKLHETPQQLIQLYGKAKVTDPDAEQELDETNCGARCVAWLMVNELFGFQEAKCI